MCYAIGNGVRGVLKEYPRVVLGISDILFIEDVKNMRRVKNCGNGDSYI